MKKLAIVVSHPIQYYAPWFKLLAERQNIKLKVFYTWSQAAEDVEDKTFGKTIKWDIPLLEGYDYEFVENSSKDPGTHHKNGIICPELIAKVSAWHPDAILVFGWYLKSHFKVMKHFKGKIPVWFRGDSTLLDEISGVKTILRRFYLTWVYKHIDKAFYVGAENKRYFKAHGVKEYQLVFAPHAIDNSRFADSEIIQYEIQALEWRKELGFSEDDIVILFAGKFEAKKQPDFLLKAFQKANKDREIPLKFVLVGHGPLENKLKDLAENDRNITVLPFQNQSKMPILYRLGDVICLPSKGPGETWGLAVNEAMASRRPVIVSSKVGCASDLVRENVNGFVFDYNNHLALEKILTGLNKHELQILGNKAKQDIKAWNFETIVGAIEREIQNNI
ncbi:glycosyltransferase family 4 protein [Mangrovimonas sp. YM274]|uniref:glycosyltransferase family 4 protein n=1 Tax=Mangrovimonas sp. YM274 TaxID=3070660 RepID=UPI0027DBF591|nr:glycosyltransferase family 4 protein [Mangrovimonas sp. YM274]WMI68445.1 glycosyltransferase family 4 protein [Mangrovimonas sp. YM274]